MKSKYFKDMQGLDSGFDPTKTQMVSICLRLDRHAYDYAIQTSADLGISSGAYIQMLLKRDQDSKHHQ